VCVHPLVGVLAEVGRLVTSVGQPVVLVGAAARLNFEL
jgi:hypothetical protein